MLLAIDVGNTNVTIGVFEGPRLVHNWRLAALRERTADELGILVTRLFEQAKIDVAAVSGIAVASVVPPLTRPMEEMCQRYFGRKALVVDATNAGMPVRYTPAGDVGADRIRSEEHTSELQSLAYLVCRLLLEKKKKKKNNN